MKKKMKKLVCARQRHLCRGCVLCRALTSVFAMRRFFAVRWLRSLPCALVPLCRALLIAVCSLTPLPYAISLPCVVLLSHSKEIFAV
jgi:hypothetical protein